jgi:O-antigen ligase
VPGPFSFRGIRSGARATPPGYNGPVSRGRAPVALALIAGAAAWFAARSPLYLPLVWVALLLLVLTRPEAARRQLASPAFLLALALVASSWMVALDHELACRLSLHLVLLVLVFGLARQAPLDGELQIAVALLIAATSTVALLQAAGGLSAMQDHLGELPPGWREVASQRLATGRAFGTSALPGHFAALQLLALPLLIDGARRGGTWRRLSCGVGLALGVAGITVTHSLAVLVIAATLLAVTLLATPSRRRAVTVGVAVLVVATALAVLWRPDVLELTPIRLRWINWRTAWSALGDHPWLGVGFGGVGQAGLVTPFAAANITPYAHNTLLQLAAELGVAGAGALLLGLAALLELLRRGLRSAPALTLAVAAVPLHNLLDFSLYVPEVAIPWAVLAGSLAARAFPASSPPRRRSWWLVPTVAVGVVLATLEWRGELDSTAALDAPPAERTAALLAASRWRPWSCGPAMLAAGEAVAGHSPVGDIEAVDAALAGCAWVRPQSASWAEARARVLLAVGRPGEALVWAGEAGRRAPLRADLAALEAACRPAS